MAETQEQLYVIRKEKARVVAWTAQFRVEGTVHFIPKARVSDLLNRRDIAFIPMTEVVLYDQEGKEIQRAGFMAVNKDQITALSVDS